MAMTTTSSPSPDPKPMSDTIALSQYLTFKLDREVYAVDIAKVREVLEFTSLTRVPRTPEFMRGVINLRGSVVPIIDMRLKLGLQTTEKTVDTCVIITEVDVDNEKLVLGALVDSVQEVVDLDAAQIVAPPRVGTRVNTEFMRGIGKRDDGFLILLDLDRVFSSDDVPHITSNEAGEPDSCTSTG
jgi:purine-binding chemotaxis protein CheW